MIMWKRADADEMAIAKWLPFNTPEAETKQIQFYNCCLLSVGLAVVKLPNTSSEDEASQQPHLSKNEKFKIWAALKALIVHWPVLYSTTVKEKNSGSLIKKLLPSVTASHQTNRPNYIHGHKFRKDVNLNRAVKRIL